MHSEREQLLSRWRPPDAGANRRLGMGLFLVSLGVLFLVSLVGYFYFWLTSPAIPPPGHTQLPGGLWVSTAALMAAGLAVHQVAGQARRGHFARLRAWLLRTWVLSAIFIGVQAPCVLALLRQHRFDLMEHFAGLYGMTFTLIVIHALHVVGGMVPLSLLTLRALRGRLDSEHLHAVRSCTAYWHFLEGVWVVLFATFLLTT